MHYPPLVVHQRATNLFVDRETAFMIDKMYIPPTLYMGLIR